MSKKISDTARAIFNAMPIGKVDPAQYLRLHKIIDAYIQQEIILSKDKPVEISEEQCDSIVRELVVSTEVENLSDEKLYEAFGKYILDPMRMFGIKYNVAYELSERFKMHYEQHKNPLRGAADA